MLLGSLGCVQKQNTKLTRTGLQSITSHCCFNRELQRWAGGKQKEARLGVEVPLGVTAFTKYPKTQKQLWMRRC